MTGRKTAPRSFTNALFHLPRRPKIYPTQKSTTMEKSTVTRKTTTPIEISRSTVSLVVNKTTSDVGEKRFLEEVGDFYQVDFREKLKVVGILDL